VVERIHECVPLLADVAGARHAQCARGARIGAADQVGAARLVVDAGRSAGRRRGDHRAVGILHDSPLLEAARDLHRLEHLRRRSAHGLEVGVELVELAECGQDPERRLEIARVDRGRAG